MENDPNKSLDKTGLTAITRSEFLFLIHSVQDKEDEVSKVKEDLENAKAASKKLEKEVEKLKKKNDVS